MGILHRSPAAKHPAQAAAAALGIVFGIAMAVAFSGVAGLIGQTNELQWVGYVAAFGLLLPLSAALALRQAAPGRSPEALPAAVLAAGAMATALLCSLRLLDLAGLRPGAVALAAIIGGLGVGALALLGPGLFSRDDLPAIAFLRSATGESGSVRLPAAALALLGAVLLVFVSGEVSAAAVAGCVLVALAVAVLWQPGRALAPGRSLGIVLDVVLLAIVVLAVVDLSGYWGEDFGVSSWSTVPPWLLGYYAQIHEHFYLGAANDVLHGRALLVDANAVYGIGNTYLIAAWFQIAPLGYGPFGLLGGLMSAATCVLGWAILMLSGVQRLLAGAVVLVAVILTVLAPLGSPALFLNVGGLRFAPPYLLVVVALLVCGRPGGAARSPWVLGTFAFFSLWSVEALAYCGGTYVGLAIAEAGGSRPLRRIVADVARSLALVLGACVAAHVLFALATRVLGGDWPDWGGYWTLFKAWSDILADVFRADVQPWSRVWPMALLYVASGVGVLVRLQARPLEEGPAGPGLSERRMTLALAGATALGASLLSYFFAHAGDIFLPFIAYPALIVGGLWLSLALRTEGVDTGWRRAGLAACAFVAALLVAGSWPEAERRLPRTALAHLVPGGPSVGEDLSRMWDSPPVDPRAVAAERLIDRHFPSDKALVLIEPDLGQEALLRSGRANLVPISYPWQDGVAMEQALPPVIEAIGEFEAGTPALLQGPIRPDTVLVPSLGIEQAFGAVPEGRRLSPLTAAALREVRRRFDLRAVARGPDGLLVARLEQREPS